MRTIAPAKINWTLEVLGKREDGYHEIRSVMQTIDLCDDVVVEAGGMRKKEEGWVRAGSAWLAVQGEHTAAEDDLTLRAVSALEKATGRELPVAISLVKRIPVASGLGGGSSDAAAVLRLVDDLYALGFSKESLAEVGATIGSDVPFFIYGGTALIEGRGERVTQLQDVEPAWLTVVVPKTTIEQKTRAMYAGLTPADYTDGSHTNRVRAALSGGASINDKDTFNVFDQHVHDLVEDLEELSHGLFMEGLFPVHVVGAGPAVFVDCDDKGWAESLAAYADAFTEGIANTFVARTLTGRDATSISNAAAGLPS